MVVASHKIGERPWWSSSPGVGKLFCTTDRFKPGTILLTDPQITNVWWWKFIKLSVYHFFTSILLKAFIASALNIFDA